ncbi:DUF4241 domain-containing protein [Vibrio clamense]|uniref:DUF4241 domain-containing protein n=1 Tax=Vibrio TaxID=662 RepID=UPI0010BE12F5|nr:DUF4241 domain-containing protein [Vibrio genomosp. F6]TKF18032.1 DUF4241 domain-containing protein [Vibrio genomosp. F6]
MQYPNGSKWSALKSEVICDGDDKVELSTIPCGKLKLPSGKLIVCDPFTGLSKSNNIFIQIIPGEYEVIVTLADVSPNLDGSHVREAYASLIIDANASENSRKLLELSLSGEPSNRPLNSGEFFGYGVDAGTSCFADAETIEQDMPVQESWYEGLFENSDSNCWFDQMDDEKLIRNGIANILLPKDNGNNLILFHSGWGDGFYPVVGSYDLNGVLIAVHTDFFVVQSPEDDEETNSSIKKPWWKFWA